MAYSNYSGQCVGRILYFLYKTDSLLGEHSYIGDGKITKDYEGNDLIATFSWNNDGDGDIPIFKFTDKYSEYQLYYENAKVEILKKEVLLGNKTVYSKKVEQALIEEEKRIRWENIKKQIMESK
jgi:hypothetical protein